MSLTISLNKANKLLARLKKEEKDGSTVRFHNYFTPAQAAMPKTLENLQKQATELLAAFQNARLLQDDLSALKEALFEANVTSGVSRLLARHKVLDARVRILTQVANQLRPDGDTTLQFDELTQEHLSAAFAGLAETRHSLYVNVMSMADTVAQLAEVRTELAALDDQLAAANATNTVTVDLSPYTLGLLGLKA